MGRELVMVPPNWEHPKEVRRWGEEDYKPMFNRDYESAKKEWIDGLVSWEKGERPSHFKSQDVKEYWTYCGQPPERDDYVPFRQEECSWFQVWETVSEGTPVTPPFETKDELIDYLCSNGDFWDQSRGAGPWTRENATAFVMGSGYAPSMMIVNGLAYTSKETPTI